MFYASAFAGVFASGDVAWQSRFVPTLPLRWEMRYRDCREDGSLENPLRTRRREGCVGRMFDGRVVDTPLSRFRDGKVTTVLSPEPEDLPDASERRTLAIWGL